METVTTVMHVIWKLISTPLFEISGNKISVISFFMAIFLFLIFFKASKWADKMVGSFLEDKDLERGLKGSIQRITRYIVLVIGVFIIFDSVGISLSSLAAIGAVVMVGVGFGLQNITSNFISGYL